MNGATMDRLLVLVRHGQSEWNLKNLFTGWKDIGLTEQGIAEAKSAGVKLKKLGLTDAHNGLRVFDKTVADGLNLTMSGMSHASEFVALIVENGWRVAEQPVEILYTEYSMSKGQPLLNGVNIIFDGWLRGRMSR